MPRTIPHQEISRWVQRHEDGEPIATIAKASKKDPRVVHKHVEAVLRHREVKAAERRLVEDALRRHQEDLMAVVNELASALAVPASQGYLAIDLEGLHATNIRLESLLVTHGASGYESIHLGVEDRRTWAFLRGHLRTDKLWARLSQWKRAYLAAMNEGLWLLETVRQRAEERTGIEVQSAPHSEPCLLPPYPSLLYQSVVPRRTSREGRLWEAKEVDIGPDGTLRFYRGGHDMLLARVPGREQEVKATMLALLEEIPQWPEATRFQAAEGRVEARTREISRTVEDILLTHYVPGQCEVCRRLGA